jgi:hypothetical protein
MDFGAVNRAVVAYFAEGGPVGDHNRRDSAFAGAQDLLQAVVGIVRESLSIPAHWNTTSPATGAVLMKCEMKRRHAELDELALDALARNFAAAWR